MFPSILTIHLNIFSALLFIGFSKVSIMHLVSMKLHSFTNALICFLYLLPRALLAASIVYWDLFFYAVLYYSVYDSLPCFGSSSNPLSRSHTFSFCCIVLVDCLLFCLHFFIVHSEFIYLFLNISPHGFWVISEI